MRLGSAFWLRFEDSPAPFLRFGSLRFETCVLRLELRFGCVLKTVLHFSCVLKLRLELRFEPLRSAFAFRGTLSLGGRSRTQAWRSYPPPQYALAMWLNLKLAIAIAIASLR